MTTFKIDFRGAQDKIQNLADRGQEARLIIPDPPGPCACDGEQCTDWWVRVYQGHDEQLGPREQLAARTLFEALMRRMARVMGVRLAAIEPLIEDVASVVAREDS